VRVCYILGIYLRMYYDNLVVKSHEGSIPASIQYIDLATTSMC